MQIVINAGSSSVKFAIFSSPSANQAIVSGGFDRMQYPDCSFTLGSETVSVGKQTISSAIQFLSQQCISQRIFHPDEVQSCVHRIVHGGEKYSSPVIITDSVRADINALSDLAPLHNPVNLEGVSACEQVFSNATQVAVFDTAFHHTIPKEVFLYGIPYELYEKHHIRKYGFHGISHSFISDTMRDTLGHPPSIICAHLGSGSSITAIAKGKSVDTTMGFTPLDGVMMSTRSGEIDPEIPMFLLRKNLYSVEQLDSLFSKQSGLLGISGHADLRDVYEAACDGDEHSSLALEMLCYDIAYYINALRTGVRSPEAIVFTAGIGEKAWYVRERVCQYLGISVDSVSNMNNERVISAANEPIPVIVLHTDEQFQMHRLAAATLQE